MIFYGLKTCDTCRKAQKELGAAGIDFNYIDVRADGIKLDKIRQWAEKTDWKKLLNTRSTTWRQLSEKDKADLDKDKAISLMCEHATLIKRPVIEKNDQVFVGWKANTKTELGL